MKEKEEPKQPDMKTIKENNKKLDRLIERLKTEKRDDFMEEKPRYKKEKDD